MNSKVSGGDTKGPGISLLVKSLSGVLPLPKGFDAKKVYGDHIMILLKRGLQTSHISLFHNGKFFLVGES